MIRAYLKKNTFFPMAAIARSVSPEESRESSRNSNKIRPDFPLMQDKSGQQKQVANELRKHFLYSMFRFLYLGAGVLARAFVTGSGYQEIGKEGLRIEGICLALLRVPAVFTLQSLCIFVPEAFPDFSFIFSCLSRELGS
mmetsp:Transcript_11498/g.30557  ORF Transcript_11498/g.30557 Transcript_11498/m.30557 type:complete len:140 (+) Transcript_11498:269-688(+)